LRPVIADIIGGEHITPIDDQPVRMNLDRVFDRKSAPYDGSDRDHEQRRGEQRLQERQLAAAKEPPAARSACHDPGEHAHGAQERMPVLIAVADQNAAARREHARIAVERAANGGIILSHRSSLTHRMTVGNALAAALRDIPESCQVFALGTHGRVFRLLEDQ
jgi:hypothetical protein